jgi:transcriptional regulator GlxA family with amidase domain
MIERVLTVGIVAFEAVETLDLCGPFEVFSVTRYYENRLIGEPPPFRVLIVAGTCDPVSTVGGMRVLPNVSFDACPPLDLLVVPGGQGARIAMQDAALLAWLRTRAGSTPRLASICTGSFILARAGLLAGLDVTSHWQTLGDLAKLEPTARVHGGRRWIESQPDRLWTSAGISAGIDLSLELVARMCGLEIAQETARQMEYSWQR